MRQHDGNIRPEPTRYSNGADTCTVTSYPGIVAFQLDDVIITKAIARLPNRPDPAKP